MESNFRHVCTKEDPYDKTKHPRAEHPFAYEVDNPLCDCCAKYECPNCGIRFKCELPQ